MTTAVAVMSASASSATARATTTRPLLVVRNNLATPSSSLSYTLKCRTKTRRLVMCCEVAVKSDSSIDNDPSSSPSEDEELKSNLEKVGCKVRVKAPLTVYHVPKLPELELTPDMVGVIKHYVGFWKGKYISPNYPFKVEFMIDVQGRGPVKVVTHLREDEFEIIH